MKKTLKKYFIPHEENDHKPHFLRKENVFKTSFFVAVLFLLSLVGNYTVQNNKHLATIKTAFLVDLTNEDRVDRGLSMLAINNQLVNAAELKAFDMSEKSYFAHVSPEGINPWYWIQQAGYPYIYAGENLAVNFFDSSDVQRAWMNSPTHRENILSNNFTEIGIATSRGLYKGDQTTFVVQMFGSQAGTSIPASTLESNVVESENILEQAPENDSVLGSETSNIVEEVPLIESVPKAETQQTFVSFVNPEATPEDIQQIKVIPAEETQTYTNWFQRLMVSPTNVVDSLYAVLAVVVIFSLILKIFIEIRKQHPRNIAYGVLLLVLIIAFMHLNRVAFTDHVLVVGAFIE